MVRVPSLGIGPAGVAAVFSDMRTLGILEYRVGLHYPSNECGIGETNFFSIISIIPSIIHLHGRHRDAPTQLVGTADARHGCHNIIISPSRTGLLTKKVNGKDRFL